MEKLSKLPHKVLFYFGFCVVLFFIFLSFWQYTSYQNDKVALDKFENTYQPTPINISQLYLNNSDTIFEFNSVEITDNNNLTPIRVWYLRSRVNNGQNGYNLITLYKEIYSNQYLLVNNGWIPLDKNVTKTFTYQEISFTGRLTEYDKQTLGQDDISNSEYLFRIDKEFIENEENIVLPDYYLTLTEGCGSGVECIDLQKPFDAPHLSYALQWLFFAICLCIVILRKNKIL
ncbi:MAG: SURF1 family protein [Actinomycetota bacterium]|nr:SURF1 family protein [Actinomycetota bacterium]